jgi:fructokinase
MKILCVGEALVDMIGSGKNLKDSDSFEKRPGGAPANVAVAASRMGADVDIAATVGNDEFGDLLIDKFEEEDVGVENVDRSASRTTQAFVALEGSEPSFSFYRGADHLITGSQLDDNYEIIHFGSLPFTDPLTSEELFEFAKEAESIISFDPNLREDLVDGEYLQRIQKMLDISDIVFLSDEEVSELDLSNVPEVVLSRGSEGAEIKGRGINKSPPDVDAVDTTGAGDALTGSYLAFRDISKPKALEKAVEASAYSTRNKGAMSALPRKEQLN